MVSTATAAAAAAAPAARIGSVPFLPSTSHPQQCLFPRQRHRSIPSYRAGAGAGAVPSPAAASRDSPAAADLCGLPPALRDIVALFQSAPDERTRYQQLLHYGRRLPGMDSVHKNQRNLVRGCTSRVWVRALKDGDGDKIVFEADSDTMLVRGIAALLVMGLSGSTAKEIAALPVGFIELLGLQQSLSRSRNSGMMNMLRLMQRKAIEVESGINGEELDGIEGEDKASLNGFRNLVEDVGSGGVVSNDTGTSANANLDATSEELDETAYNVHKEYDENSDDNGVVGGRKERIRKILEEALSPVEFIIEDVSGDHKGHSTMVGKASKNGETHFNLRLVSEEFEGKSMLKRHRLVYNLLQDELNSGLHALSIDAKAPSEL